MDIFTHIEIADIIDVAIVAILIYVGLVWFKRTRTFLILAGIVILGVVFAFARFFNLYLTTAILQGFFAVLLIAIIVIFQEELRHFFERIALWGLGRDRFPAPAPLVEALVRATVDMARQRVGALIVLVGRDPIERHVEGGYALEGRLSEALLKSIFDPHSPGHDGAAIIMDNRLARFACHLPLSKDINKTAGFGTRHAAALGLAERCDALCIVVSEERGTISFARDGDIVPLKDFSQLGPKLNDYFRLKFPAKKKKRIASILTVNWKEKIAAVGLACALWLMFSQTDGVMQRDFVIPIEFGNMAENLVVDRAIPRKLTVTLSGDERAFKILRPDDMKASVDLSSATPGRQMVQVKKSDVARIPRGLTLEAVHPSEVELTLQKSDSKEGTRK